MSGDLTYRGAGVDVGAADRLVARIAGLAAATHGPEVEPGPAAFGRHEHRRGVVSGFLDEV